MNRHGLADNFKLFMRMDKLALLLLLMLLATGVLFIYGAGLEVGGDLAEKWRKQLQWIGLGGVLYVICAAVDYRFLGRWSWVGYVAGLILLAMVFPFGRVINNARSWISLPGIGMLQPSELAKPAVLLFMSWAVAHPAIQHSRIPRSLIVAAIVLPPMTLVMMQPDYGTALVFIPFAFAILFINGFPWKCIIGLFLAGLLLLPIGFSSLQKHQKERLKVFLEAPAHMGLAALAPLLPEGRRKSLEEACREFFAENDEELGRRDDWNARQSLLAVGSGGIRGKGYLHGTQHVLGYLPRTVAPTDFIFSVIAEETGFVGAASLVLLQICLILCACRTAFLAPDAFGTNLAIGVAAIWATHAFINVGMTVQAAPIIGIPLPYVSYGGSFMLGMMMLAGLVQNVAMRRQVAGADGAEENASRQDAAALMPLLRR